MLWSCDGFHDRQRRAIKPCCLISFSSVADSGGGRYKEAAWDCRRRNTSRGDRWTMAPMMMMMMMMWRLRSNFHVLVRRERKAKPVAAIVHGFHLRLSPQNTLKKTKKVIKLITISPWKRQKSKKKKKEEEEEANEERFYPRLRHK